MNKNEHGKYLNFFSLLSILQNGMWLQSDIEEYLKRFNMSHGQYSILLVLLEAEDRQINATQIAGKLGRSKPTITRMIEKLILQGYVVCSSNKGDLRKKEYILTDSAKALMDRISPEYMKRIDTYCMNISDFDKLMLINICNKLNIGNENSYKIKQNALSNSEKSNIIETLCKSGSKYDIDCVISFLDQDVDIPTTKYVDYYLGTVTNPQGIERIEHYLFNGTQIQRNYSTLFFLRRNEWQAVNKAYKLGLIDYKQAYSR
jgi:DNA-binding MarR family transcriptional regulator